VYCGRCANRSLDSCKRQKSSTSISSGFRGTLMGVVSIKMRPVHAHCKRTSRVANWRARCFFCNHVACGTKKQTSRHGHQLTCPFPDLPVIETGSAKRGVPFPVIHDDSNEIVWQPSPRRSEKRSHICSQHWVALLVHVDRPSN